MQKLITKFKQAPTPANRQRLQDYINKHGMAICLLATEDVAYLLSKEFSI